MKKTILLALLFSVSVNAAELVALKDYLKTELSSSAKMGKESFNVSAADKKELTALCPDADDSSFTFYYGRTADGKMEKACTVVPQKGKEGPLSVGVCFDASGIISGVTILSHEEERGKGIQEESYLKQFKGKKVADAFVLGKDVNGVSGATWSSKAMAEATRKASFAFKKYVGSKK
jgi:Na+-translocating ferredoxin:NAD+ oxidoreductase RnfG subunit